VSTVLKAFVALMAPLALAQTPANEHNCPATTAIPPYVGPGTAAFSRNQNLCLPRLAPVGSVTTLGFIVQGSEPGDRVDSQGSIYVVSIRGVPGGVDLWRWYPPADGVPNRAPGITGTLPFKYEGQPDNCGIYSFAAGGCANNVGSPGNPGVAPGGGDADIATNAPNPVSNIPNLPLTSLTLAPGVTATDSTDRGDSFGLPNVAAALIPGDDRQWQDGIDSSTVYLSYHDVATDNIDVQRSNDGGVTYINGAGAAIDAATLPAAGTLSPTDSGNIAGQIRIDQSQCPSRGNVYAIFAAPDSAAENLATGALRTVYVGVSTDAKNGLSSYTFTDHKIYASPAGSLGATNGTANIFPALATDGLGYVYAVWSDNSNIYFAFSPTQGNTWSAPVRVNSGATVGMANVFPWVAADANGHAVVAWLGANQAGNSNDPAAMQPACADGTNSCWAQWSVYLAETVNGHSRRVKFVQYTASDHFIHAGTVSTGGLGGSANRNLGDFFQVALDRQHRANISFADDHLASPECASQSPGHCADNDPLAFRVGTPYFTYQSKANPHIVTRGACTAALQP
jgi:hypothetical protein